MPALQGRVTFPGVNQVLSASFTLSHGTSPSTGTIEVPQQGSSPGIGGPLGFSFGGTSVVLHDCRIVEAATRQTENGPVATLKIEDRRWKWRFGGPREGISGHYNQRLDNGELDTATQKTPQELAALLLDALGETGYDVSGLPLHDRPTVDWEYTLPAQALGELCDLLHCRVVLQLDNRIAIRPEGVGAQLPTTNTILENSLTIDPPEMPDSILVVGEPNRYQTEFALEAVGLDTDGRIRALNDLSYKPTAGWTGITLPSFGGVSGDSAKELARKTVFRWYRVALSTSSESAAPPSVQGYGTLTDLKQILPLEEVQVDTWTDPRTSKKTAKPAQVFGTYAKGGVGYTNYDARTEYKRPFRVNKDLGVVEFDEAVYQWDGSKRAIAATLVLRTSCFVRSATTRSFVRYTRELRLTDGRFQTGPQLLHIPELQRTFAQTVGSGGSLGELVDNVATVNQEADYYLANAARAYQVDLPEERAYAGFLPVNPDGAIAQVAFNLAPNGDPTTRVSRNFEASKYAPTYQERRRQEKAASDELNEALRQARLARSKAQGKR